VTDRAEEVLAETFQVEWPRLVAAAMRIAGDLRMAEDVVQDSFLAALDNWALTGVPERPGAWLMTVCRNRARNATRDAGRADRKAQSLQPMVVGPPPADEGLAEIADDQLRLIAMCCHPLLSENAQIALTLRMVAGLTTEEIARGFRAPIPTIAQRIARAKRVLAEHRVTFASDSPVLPDRVPAVLDVIYLIFNEGYLAAAGETLTRGDLAFEGYRLSCLLTQLAAGESAPWALRALVCFQLSRRATRTGPDGELLTLDVQDRGQWDRVMIADGVEALARARRGGRSQLVVQAELAACHATAPTADATDWTAIVALYDELLAMEDSPVVALNRAVAVTMAAGPGAALPLLDDLTAEPTLAREHRVWAVRADVHSRLGHDEAALADYQRALELVRNDVERRYLAGARARLADRSDTGQRKGW
jgi:RNA polymerase sigma-70 factor (ECF subfamily)